MRQVLNFNNKNWPLPTIFDDRLRFIADEASSFYLSKRSSNQSVAEYSTDGKSWTDIPTTVGDAVSMSAGDIVYLRGKLTGDNGGSVYSNIKVNSGSVSVAGNIMYWYDYEHPELTTITYVAAFRCLFQGTSNARNNISSVSQLSLPATNVSQQCYQLMFQYSTVTNTPLMQITTLNGHSCCKGMFLYCTSLTTVPSGLLPATTLVESSYALMFDGCTSLTNAPILPATQVVKQCYQTMFRGCSSLTTAPELPATILAEQCYNYMFESCSNLSYIKCLATNISASSCLSSWVSGVASSGTFVKAASMSDWPTGTSGIPRGWTVQDAQ